MLNWIVIIENEVIASFASRTDAKAFASSYPEARVASIAALILL